MDRVNWGIGTLALVGIGAVALGETKAAPLVAALLFAGVVYNAGVILNAREAGNVNVTPGRQWPNGEFGGGDFGNG